MIFLARDSKRRKTNKLQKTAGNFGLVPCVSGINDEARVSFHVYVDSGVEVGTRVLLELSKELENLQDSMALHSGNCLLLKSLRIWGHL